MDLAQFPIGPRGTVFDTLADSYDDPTYRFNYRTVDQSRLENSDATGKVTGLYSYTDDVGELHSVRYAAGAGIGFEVVNSVPDNPSIVSYSGPLYKAPAKTRGRISNQRGANGTYKLIATGPDHRRIESRAPDGLVRGTYSFLDDKGIQHTVDYIAGAGIGYRVVQNLKGPGTHVNNPDFLFNNDFGNTQDTLDTKSIDRSNTGTNVNISPSRAQGGYSSRRPVDKFLTRKDQGTTMESHISKKPHIKIEGKKSNDDHNNDASLSGLDSFAKSMAYNGAMMATDYNYYKNEDEGGNIPTVNTAYGKVLENERNRDISLIRNVGKWYIGLPPGQTVRAHVQNIDILPLDGRRVESPSEALRKDEFADMVSSLEGETRTKDKRYGDKKS